MRRFTGIATLQIVLGAGLLLPAYAQHGGSHGGFSGHAGGGHIGSGFASGSGGFRPSAPNRPIAPGRSYGYAPRPGTSNPGSGVRTGYGFQDQTSVRDNAPMRVNPGTSPRYAPRANNYAANRSYGQTPYRRPYRSPSYPPDRRGNRGGFVYGYSSRRYAPYYFGYPLGLGFYGDDGFYDDSYNEYPGPYTGPDQYNGFDPQAVPPDQMQYQIQGPDQNGPDQIGQDQNGPDQEQAQYPDRTYVPGPYPDQYPNQIPPGAPYQPFYGPNDGSANAAQNGRQARSPRPSYSQSRPLANEPAVTLVFNDKRPNQIIHNYLINGGTLTVWDQSAHDIPIAQIDVEATRQINRDKGIDFLLPGAKF